ncbi:superoxide dismutase family protein [Ideonella livida]|uniref:Superoxide dismutase [Cu-Zn] n=1 Tax=Ideonella livida TaxID=2707176 RepID=A0A7C9PJR6_9BURK|nr:superoxide dismutase family protein [Ideonella livida]NDY92810.1 superoxide dismutase family protein [Ideonella livida]
MSLVRSAGLTATAALLAALTGCAAFNSDPTAVALLQPTKGNSASGQVVFTQHGAHVMVSGSVTGLKPGQQHGFHVHEVGDCSSGDGMSTKGHFNPDGKPHGPQHAAHHAGDMPALQADANGKATFSFHLDGVTLTPGPTSLVGRGLIVHAGPDDYTTQPTGNAGARIACAVIKAE